MPMLPFVVARTQPRTLLIAAAAALMIGLSGGSVGAFAAAPRAQSAQDTSVAASYERQDSDDRSNPYHRRERRTSLLVGYLPDYDGSYAVFAKTLDFSKMTHLYLAFGVPPTCNGTCTESSDMQFSLGQTDADIRTLVDAAHAADVKVVLSIGGGGGDQQILQFYNAGLSKPLVKSLDKYIREHNLDGVDLDIEDPNNMGEPYAVFTRTLIETFHPLHKIVTAAVAEYLQSSMPDSALHMFDFINVMNYSNYSDAETALEFYNDQKKVPKERITLGVPFFGQSADGDIEETYSTILAAYPDAWQSDEVSGGSLDGGVALYYVGETTMARETRLGKEYGGVMIWELSQDAPAPHSLMSIIDKNI